MPRVFILMQNFTKSFGAVKITMQNTYLFCIYNWEFFEEDNLILARDFFILSIESPCFSYVSDFLVNSGMNYIGHHFYSEKVERINRE